MVIILIRKKQNSGFMWGIAAIMFWFFFIFSLLMGFNADDYWWGGNRTVWHYLSGQQFMNYDGRYLGNSLAIAGFQHPWLSAFIFGATMAAIVCMFYWLSQRLDVTLLGALMIFLLPRPIFAQTLGWKSGFFNYVLSIIPIFLLLVVADWIILRDQNQYQTLSWYSATLVAIVLFLGSFLSEPITLVLVASSLVLLFVARFRIGRIPPQLIVFFFSILLGFVLMVINKGYWVSQNVHTFNTGIIRNMSAILIQVADMHWLILFVGTAVVLFANTNRQIPKPLLWLSGAGYAFYTVFFLVIQPRLHFYRSAILVSLLALLWAFVLLFLARSALTKRHFWICLYLILAAVGTLVPYLVIAPFGPRCAAAFFILLIALAMDLMSSSLPQHLAITTLAGVICILLMGQYAAVALKVGEAKQKNTALITYQADHKTYVKSNRMYYVQIPHQDYWWNPRPQTKDEPILNYYAIPDTVPGSLVSPSTVRSISADNGAAIYRAAVKSLQ